MVALSSVPLAADGERLTMKTSTELTETHWTGADEFKRSATRLKRLAGGLRNEVVATTHGLSENEAKALAAAIKVVDELASHYGKAAALSKKRVDDRTRAEKRLRAAMTGNFLSLSAVEDRVAFIGATHSWRLRTGNVVTLEDLDYYFKEELDSFVYRMSGELKDRTPEVAAAEAWATFEGGRSDLVHRHRELIQKLQRTPTIKLK